MIKAKDGRNRYGNPVLAFVPKNRYKYQMTVLE